ncbi:hypothetical protein PVT67_02830 [Gallaecimonas kandeliae]|uniref:hypothetical protein n=1 Tax=Gallaecimonas kandeliae TaxID=3029055 RepID=UPI00264A36BF|nr:hypothetical protein [Gallaecimonas kandeliae]WKE66197.1 hypothetical protein PVT67_02830 [Gallaecimonas kandeliae]
MQQHPSSGRAKGALIMALFGSAWLLLACNQLGELGLPALAAVAAVTLLLLAGPLKTLRAGANRPMDADARRGFLWVNLVQWLALVVGGNLLSLGGHPQWLVPFALLVIGLHFLPLARLLRYRPHYLTGAALVLLALLVPVLAGPASPLASLGAGLVLWLSALGAGAKASA